MARLRGSPLLLAALAAAWHPRTASGARQSASEAALEPDEVDAIRFSQYNILASRMNNEAPWFLLPLNITVKQRQELLERHAATAVKDGQTIHPNTFANGYNGLLSEEERALVTAEEKKSFSWSVRRDKLLHEVQSWNSDVIALVEMDQFDDFKQALGPDYDGVFEKRPGRAPDGSSLFWRKERFQQVGEPLRLAFKDWQPAQKRYSPDRVVVAAALRHIPSERVLVTAAVHLMKEPASATQDSVRLMEVSQMMIKLAAFVRESKAAGLVVLGDFNALPESYAYRFMLEGGGECSLAEWSMHDAFEGLSQDGGGEHCTTRTSARRNWIDYIFYSASSLELAGPPSVERCPGNPIPDEKHASDHLPVHATMRFLNER